MGKNKIDIRNEIKSKLHEMERFGESKYEAKLTGDVKHGIYSYSTATAYNRDCQRFADYAIEQHGNRYMSLDDARQYAEGFLRSELSAGRSVYTVKAERAALAKLYQCDGRKICELPNRSRADITRSRERYVTSAKTGKQILNPSSRAGHFSEKNHRDIVDFCRSTGLRRSELQQLRGDQLRGVDINGRTEYAIVLDGSQCKGGRSRWIPIVVGNIDNVVQLMESAGSGRVFDSVPAAMDVHHYRSEFASNLYAAVARPVNEIPRDERYCCRGELKGTWYDKRAMRIVSEALGHNRISVIAEHYLR